MRKALSGRSWDARGQVLVGVLLVMMVLLIFVPFLVESVRRESRWSVKEKKSTTAFHLAEAAVDRGYWKLVEKTGNWDTVKNGGTLPGYANDTVYGDIPGGSYKISIASGPSSGQVLITGTGRDSSSGEFRAVRALHTKGGLTASIHASGVGVTGSVSAYWGPVASILNVEMTGSSNQLYPRKYARLAVSRSGNYNGSPFEDSNPTPPNKGPQAEPYTDWWSYNEPPGVPDVPRPDLAYYRSLAQAQGYYYTSNQTVSNLVDTVCTVGSDPKVRFYEGGAHFSGSKYFCGVLIVLADLNMSGSGASPQGDITVTPHSNAWQEYQVNVPVHAGDNSDTDYYAAPGTHPGTCDPPHGDTDALHEYPGDGGYHLSEPFNFKTGCTAHNELGGVGGEALSFKGYIYVQGGSFNASGSVRIYGAVQDGDDDANLSGSVEVFYDNSLSIQGLSGSISRVSWYEVPASAF